MDKDDDDFLAAVEADNKDKPEEPEALELTEIAEGLEAPKAPEPEPAAQEPPPEEPAPEAPPEQKKPEESQTAPISALLDERDRRKAAEAERDRLKASQQPLVRPDEYEDPEGARAFDQAQVASALYQTNLHWSERIATIQHGEETVRAAKEWGYKKCDDDPYFNAKVASSPDPVGYVVAEYKREEIASKVTPDEFAQFQAWKQAQGQLQAQPGGQPPPSTQTSEIPPPSLASAPSAGSILTEPEQSDEEMFDEVVGKRK